MRGMTSKVPLMCSAGWADLRERYPDSKLGPAGVRFEVDSAVVMAHQTPGDVQFRSRHCAQGSMFGQPIDEISVYHWGSISSIRG
jgi:hypothetical protein